MAIASLTRDAFDVADELITTIDATATGSLHRCHLALESDGAIRGFEPDEWLPLAYEHAADWLEHASPSADPPPPDRARPAGWPIRRARDRLPLSPRRRQRIEVITDTLAHLLTACVFAVAAACSRPND